MDLLDHRLVAVSDILLDRTMTPVLVPEAYETVNS